MDLISEFNGIVRGLENSRVRYAVIGALAVAVHGGARATKDMDFLIYPDDLEEMTALLKTLGYIRGAEG
jgi:hypothetical protein